MGVIGTRDAQHLARGARQGFSRLGIGGLVSRTWRTELSGRPQSLRW
jgi:hypothetical protein